MTMNDPSPDEKRFDHWPVSRRQFVRLSAATAGALTLSGNAAAAPASTKLTDLYEFIVEHVEADFAIPTLIELSSTAGFEELRALGHDLVTTTTPTIAAYTTLQPEEVASVTEVDVVTTLRYSPGSNPFWRLDYYPRGVFPAVDESVDFIDFEQFIDGIGHLESSHADQMRYYSIGESPGHYNLFLDEPGPQNLWVVEVTNDIDDQAAFADKEKVLFPLSIHGDERSGAEAGTRFIERLLDGREPETEALLDDIVIVFLYPNPDGWVSRDPRYRVDGDPDPNNFNRETATGVDPNRQYPTVGWINAGYYPAEPNGSDLVDESPGIDADVPSEYTETVPDALDIVEFLRGYENLRIGSDLHGKFWSTAFMDGLIVNDQYNTAEFHDLYEWNRRTQERLEAALADRLDAAQDQFAALNDEYGEAFGIDDGSAILPEPEETFTYGTILDTIDYTTTGTLISWMSHPEDQGGLGIQMMAHEMGWDNRVAGRIEFRPWLVGLQVTGYLEVIRETAAHAIRDVTATIRTGDATTAYVDTEALTRTSAALSFGDASRRTRTTHATVGHKPESVTVEVPSTAESLSLSVRPETGFVLAKLRAPDGRVVRTFNPMAGGPSDPSQGVEWAVTSPTSGAWTVELKTIRGADETTVTVDSAVLLGSEETYDAPDPKEVLGYRQRPYSVTPLAYFPDYAEYIADVHGRDGKHGKRGRGPKGNRGRGNITEEMVGLGVGAIADGALFRGNSDNLAVENLVVTHEQGRSNADYIAALDEFVANGGNLLLTDRGVALLGVMTNDRAAAFSPDDIAEIEMVSGGLSERVEGHPLLTDTRAIQRELWKAPPVGHPIGTAPVTVIDPAAFETVGGTVAGYSRGDPSGPSPADQYVSAGSLADSDGTGIHVIGGLLPPAEQSSLHPFGMLEYTAAFLGHTMLTNALGYQQVRFVDGEPVLRFGSLR